MNKVEKLNEIRKICVYCGSGPGTDPAFLQAARDFGEILAKNGIGLVYGGGGDGMMGTLARAVPGARRRPSPASSPNSWCGASTPSAARAI